MLFCCGALWTVTAATPLCGQIRIVPRAKLDSLAHPATADGAQAMRFERTQIDAGHIGEDDTPPSYTFKWHNEGTAPLIITRVQTTCGCAAATYGRQPVRTGGEGTVTVTYHPKGHPGSFDRRIFVYTQLSDKMPTAILHLTGTVIASELTDGDYPYAMGTLRLKQQSVRFAREGLQSERIECRQSHAATLRRSPAPAGNHPQVRARNPRPGRQRRPGHRVRPRAGNAQAAGPAAPDPRRARCPAERAHAADPVRRNRVRNRQKRVI